MSGFEEYRTRPHSRHQSMTANLTRLVLPNDCQQDVAPPSCNFAQVQNQESRLQVDASALRVSTSALTPPATPGKNEFLDDHHEPATSPEILEYDFSKLD